MRVLVDTHALIWFCEGSAALSAGARAAMEDGTNERFVSHATAWEMAIKHALGKLRLEPGFDVIFPGVMQANGFQMLLPEFPHYRELLTLPFHHRDPFDRLLIAQARAERLTLISDDPRFKAYDVTLLW